MSTRAPVTLVGALRLGRQAVAGHPWLAAALAVAVVTQGALQAGLVWALRGVLMTLDRAHGGSGTGGWAAGATIFALWMLRSASGHACEELSARLAHRTEIDAMRRVLAKLVTLPVRFFDKHSQGDLVMASYYDLKGIRTVTQQLGLILTSGARLAGLVVVVWVMSPTLALLGLVLVPLGALPAHWYGRRITLAAHRERASVTTLHDSFLQVASGIRLIRVNRGERAVLERAGVVAEALFEHTMRQVTARGMGRLLVEAVSGVGLVAVVLEGSREIVAGRLDWQSLLSLLIALMAVYAPVVTLLQAHGTLHSVLPNLDRVASVLAVPSATVDRPGALALTEAPAVIELDHVSFSYEGSPVLHDVSLVVRRGETVGIVGPSGAGKSTLVSLLLRLYEPTGGRILFDGVDLHDIRHADLLDRCAMVLQEPFLFFDTVANNIRVARPDATDEEVVAAAKAANVHDEIVQMEHGYATMLGRGAEARGVSVGQKQRIAIAAALLKNAPILFLDEATSNLDSVAERAVQDALERLMAGRTTFVIAHRLSTLRAADRLLVLDGGRLTGVGTHEALLKTCAVYRRLWASQHDARVTEWRARAVAEHPDAAEPEPYGLRVPA